MTFENWGNWKNLKVNLTCQSRFYQSLNHPLIWILDFQHFIYVEWCLNFGSLLMKTNMHPSITTLHLLILMTLLPLDQDIATITTSLQFKSYIYVIKTSIRHSYTILSYFFIYIFLRFMTRNNLKWKFVLGIAESIGGSSHWLVERVLTVKYCWETRARPIGMLELTL